MPRGIQLPEPLARASSSAVVHGADQSRGAPILCVSMLPLREETPSGRPRSTVATWRAHAAYPLYGLRHTMRKANRRIARGTSSSTGSHAEGRQLREHLLLRRGFTTEHAQTSQLGLQAHEANELGGSFGRRFVRRAREQAMRHEVTRRTSRLEIRRKRIEKVRHARPFAAFMPLWPNAFYGLFYSFL